MMIVKHISTSDIASALGWIKQTVRHRSRGPSVHAMRHWLIRGRLFQSMFACCASAFPWLTKIEWKIQPSSKTHRASRQLMRQIFRSDFTRSPRLI